MRISVGQFTHWGVALVCMAALDGCKPQTPQDSPDLQSANIKTPTLSVKEIRIGKTVGGDSGVVPSPQTPKDPIYVIVKTTGQSNRSKLEAKLINLMNGQEAGRQIKPMSATTPPEVQFVFRNEKGWQVGRYLVELKLDGKLAGQREMDVHGLPPEAVKAK